MHLSADLSFSVDLDESGSTRRVEGTLRGSGSHLELRVDDPAALAGKAGFAFARGLAQAMAAHGVRLALVGPDGLVATLGRVRTSWLQRRVTGSRYIRTGRLRAGLTMVRRRRHPTPVLSSGSLAPPPTPFPVAPTLARRRSAVTTTHDRFRAGRPRLVFAPGPAPWPGDPQRVYYLGPGTTTIGSAEDADLRLPDLDADHAEIRHRSDDEYVFRQVSSTAGSRVNGEAADEHLLRTGTRIELGSWALSYYREEFADHGRPYGGRVGGEVGHQRPQPSREQLQPRED